MWGDQLLCLQAALWVATVQQCLVVTGWSSVALCRDCAVTRAVLAFQGVVSWCVLSCALNCASLAKPLGIQGDPLVCVWAGLCFLPVWRCPGGLFMTGAAL
jgi:hypothetical protein